MHLSPVRAELVEALYRAYGHFDKLSANGYRCRQEKLSASQPFDKPLLSLPKGSVRTDIDIAKNNSQSLSPNGS